MKKINLIFVLFTILILNGCAKHDPQWYPHKNISDKYCGSAKAKSYNEAKTSAIDDLMQSIGVQISSEHTRNAISSSKENFSSYSKHITIGNIIKNLNDFEMINYTEDKKIFSSDHFMVICVSKHSVIDKLIIDIQKSYDQIEQNFDEQNNKMKNDRISLIKQIDETLEKISILHTINSDVYKDFNLTSKLSQMKKQLKAKRIIKVEPHKFASSFLSQLVTENGCDVSNENYTYEISYEDDQFIKNHNRTKTKVVKLISKISLKDKNSRVLMSYRIENLRRCKNTAKCIHKCLLKNFKEKLSMNEKISDIFSKL